MNATKSKLIFHLIAIVTVIIWGTTFLFPLRFSFKMA